ncbi:MAG: hypothetical protein JNK75_10475 [Betaproteobacteria bacterium]|nr:hypothetical protein [Betaproteobacteria bacterium]
MATAKPARVACRFQPRAWCRGWALCLLAIGAAGHAQTIGFKSVTLSAAQRASLQRDVAQAWPGMAFDWQTLDAFVPSVGGKRLAVSVTLTSDIVLTAAGACRRGQYRFSLEPGTGRWRPEDALTRHTAWPAKDGACAASLPPIDVDRHLPDADFLFLARNEAALRSRAAQVIGGSDCARVRFCAVTLRKIDRFRQVSPPRTITRLTYSPSYPGPACLYVMEVSFVGPLDDLVPLGASCPLP